VGNGEIGLEKNGNTMEISLKIWTYYGITYETSLKKKTWRMPWKYHGNTVS
jgi:hypothetical protein